MDGWAAWELSGGKEGKKERCRAGQGGAAGSLH